MAYETRRRPRSTRVKAIKNRSKLHGTGG
jgi:hypothetical protein